VLSLLYHQLQLLLLAPVTISLLLPHNFLLRCQLQLLLSRLQAPIALSLLIRRLQLQLLAPVAFNLPLLHSFLLRRQPQLLLSCLLALRAFSLLICQLRRLLLAPVALSLPLLHSFLPHRQPHLLLSRLLPPMAPGLPLLFPCRQSRLRVPLRPSLLIIDNLRNKCCDRVDLRYRHPPLLWCLVPQLLPGCRDWTIISAKARHWDLLGPDSFLPSIIMKSLLDSQYAHLIFCIQIFLTNPRPAVELLSVVLFGLLASLSGLVKRAL
jgi:hypothetical protein